MIVAIWKRFNFAFSRCRTTCIRHQVTTPHDYSINVQKHVPTFSLQTFTFGMRACARVQAWEIKLYFLWFGSTLRFTAACNFFVSRTCFFAHTLSLSPSPLQSHSPYIFVSWNVNCERACFRIETISEWWSFLENWKIHWKGGFRCISCELRVVCVSIQYMYSIYTRRWIRITFEIGLCLFVWRWTLVGARRSHAFTAYSMRFTDIIYYNPVTKSDWKL